MAEIAPEAVLAQLLSAPDTEHLVEDILMLNRMIVGIGEVSEITGIPQRKIRYWQEKGIIKAVPGSDSSVRRYEFLAIKKMMLIQELIEEGYTLDAAAEKVEERIVRINRVIKKLAALQSSKKSRTKARS